MGRDTADIAKRSAVVVVSVVAFCLLAWPVTDLAGYIVGALAIALTGYLYRDRGLGRAASGRALLTCGVLAAYVRAVDGVDAYLLLAAGALLIGSTLHEVALGKVAATARVLVTHVPQLATRTAPRVDPRVAYVVDTGLVVVFGVFAVLALPPWPLLVLSALACAGYGLLLLDLVLLRRARPRIWSECERALQAYEPSFALYFSGQPGLLYQLTMWLPYLDRLGRRYVVVLREPETFAYVAAMTSAPVVSCDTVATLDRVAVPSLNAAFYVNNASKNSHFVRHQRITHIQLIHGDSDKPPSFNPAAQMYDRIFVAGQAGVDRYRAHGVSIPDDRFDIVGRPQVETIKVEDGHVRDRTSKVVLYAPTWKGLSADANYSSLPVAAPLLRGLLARDVTVILRAHPYTSDDATSRAQLAALQRLLAADARASGRRHLYGAAAEHDRTIVDCFNAADALVSDVSSVVSDFLYSAKPFAITDMVDAGDRFDEMFPIARAAYVVRRDMANLETVLDELLETDPLEDRRWGARTYFLGDFPAENYADAFVSAALRYV